MKHTLVFTCLLLLIPFASATLTDNLVAYWNIDDTGSTYLDALGGHPGTAVNYQYFPMTQGIVNNARFFDRSGPSYINIQNQSGIADIGLSDFSINIWMKINTSPESGIFALFSSFGGGGIATFLQYGYIRFEVYDGYDMNLYCTNSSTYEGNWHMITFVRQSINHAIYVDGQPCSTGVSPYVINGNSHASNAVQIGYLLNSAGYPFHGPLDEVGFWNKSLSQLEIQTLYNNNMGLTYPFTFGDIYFLNESDSGYLNRNTVHIAVQTNLSNLSNMTLYVYDMTNDELIISNTTNESTLLVNYTLIDGDYVYNASASNNQVTVWSQTLNVTIDTTAPTITQVSPTDGAFLNNLNVTFNWTTDDTTATCDLYIDGGVNGPSIPAYSGTAFNMTEAVSIGRHDWFVNCSDPIGNGAWSANWSFTVDITPPQVAVVRPSNHSSQASRDILVTVNITETYLNYTNVSIINSAGDVVNSTTNDTLNFAETLTVPLDGTFNVSVTAMDNATNSVTMLVYNITVDTTAPTITLDEPDNNSVETGHAVTFNWTATDIHPVNCTIFIDGVANATFPLLSESVFNYTIHDQWVEGIYLWSVDCTDSYNNTASSETRNFILNSPPTIVLNYPDNNAYINALAVSLNWTATDVNGTVTCDLYVDNDDTATVSDITPVSYSFFSQAITFNEGLHNWSVVCNDTVGNFVQSEWRNLTIDITPPITEIFGQENNTKQRTTINLTINTTETNLNATNVFVWAGPIFVVSDSRNDFTVGFDVADGTYNITVETSDLAGNVAIYYLTNITRISNHPPELTAIPDATVYENETLIIQLNASDPENDTLLYWVDDNNLPGGHVMDENAGIFIWTPTFDQSGTYAVEFYADDGEFYVTQNTNITVLNTNRAPGITDVFSNAPVQETEMMFITVSAQDPDGDSLTFSTNDSRFVLEQTYGVANLTWTTTYYDAGEYTVLITVSDSNLTAEAVVPFTVLNVPVPDFVILPENIMFSNDEPSEGETVYITVFFENIGETHPSAVSVAFYDGDPETNGNLIAIANTGNLKTDSYAVQAEWTATRGVHDIYVIVDEDDSYTEMNEGNNIAVKTITLLRPDMRILNTSILFSNPSPHGNQQTTVFANIRNVGNAPSGPFQAWFYYDDASHIFSTQELSLEVNESQALHANWTAVEGNHTIFVSLDPQNIIDELNENNNIASRIIAVLQAYHPPHILPLPNVIMQQNSTYSFDLDNYVTDNDTTLQLLSWTVAATNVNAIINNDHVLTLYSNSWVGTTQANLTVHDPEGLADTAIMSITVQPPAPVCGNAVCEGTENCHSCPADCGCRPGQTCSNILSNHINGYRCITIRTLNRSIVKEVLPDEGRIIGAELVNEGP